MIPWRPVVWVLLFVAGWDTVGLLVGDSFYASASYDALRNFAGMFAVGDHSMGMRLYGVGLSLLFSTLAYLVLVQYRRRRNGGGISRALSFALSGLAGWWVMWTVGIAASYIEHGEVYAWGSLGKLLGISAVAVLAARVPPPVRPEPQRR